MGYIREFWIATMPQGATGHGHKRKKKGKEVEERASPEAKIEAAFGPRPSAASAVQLLIRTHDSSLHSRWGRQS